MSELAQTLKDIAKLARETVKALERRDIESANALQQQLEAAQLQLRRLKLMQQHQIDRPSLSKVPSARERTISAVLELNVPCSARLIAAYCEARTGEPFDLRALASIRRDEMRSWKSGSTRETFLSPALEGQWLEPARGKFVLSHWPLAQRIIGPLSPRVDHLRVCLHLARQAESLHLDKEASQRIRTLLAEYVRSVPHALADPWRPGPDLDLARVRDAVRAELDLIDTDDQNWRKAQAERCIRRLNAEQQVWGGTPPKVVSE